jgi:hypothetical protein
MEITCLKGRGVIKKASWEIVLHLIAYYLIHFLFLLPSLFTFRVDENQSHQYPV